MVSTASSADVAVSHRKAALLVSSEGDQTIVWLEGEHDIATVLVVAEALANVTAADHNDVVVDLSRVTFLGAATIDVLEQGRDNLRAQSRSLTLRSPSAWTGRVLEMFGFA